MIAPATAPTADLVRVRRHLHQHPELSMQEHQTADFIAEELRAMPLDDLRLGVGKTGLLGTLVGGKPGPVTLLRADIDGLPIQELTKAPYASVKPGVMHACAHDGHTSILL